MADYPWLRDMYPWQYRLTEHPCPTCGHNLTKVDVSSMLVCNEGHGPFFLV